MLIRKHEVTVDVYAIKPVVTNIHCKQSEYESNQFLIRLRDGDTNYLIDQVNDKFQILFHKADGNVVESPVTTFADASTLSYTCKGNELAFAGKVEIEVRLYREAVIGTVTELLIFPKVVVTCDTIVDVTNAIQSTSEFDTLTDLIDQVNDTIYTLVPINDTTPSTAACYSSSKIESRLATKADVATTYTKLQVDGLIDPMATETQLTDGLALKVDKVTGKQLSTEDYSTAEKSKLEGVATGANNYVHPSTHAATMIDTDSTHRFTTDTDITKLSGISTGATKAEVSLTNGNIKIDSAETTVYTHPANHAATVITEDSTHRFVTDTEKTTWNSKLSGADVVTGATATKVTYNSKGQVTAGTTLSAADIPVLDASKITTGVLDIAQIPPKAIERLVTVANQTARYALTTATVQLGDTVKETDTGLMYIVIDEANLGNANGYVVYTAGTASAVAWTGVTGKPTTVSGYGITDAVTTSTYVASDILAKLLTVDGTGSGLDADKLDGLNSTDLVRKDGTTTLTGTLSSTVAQGTAPFSVASNTIVTNLNADLLDGKHYGDITSYVSASGVTNLIKNSHVLRTLIGWSSSTYTLDSVNRMDSTANSMAMSRTGLSVDTSAFLSIIAASRPSAKQGEIYSFSVWTMSPDITLLDGATPSIRIAEYTSGDVYLTDSATAVGIKPSVSGVWQRFTITGTVQGATTAKINAITTVYRNGTLYITKPQIERGNYATDWTPAVADTADGSYVAPASMLQQVKCTSYAGANVTLSGTQTIDGSVLVAGDRVLLTNQTNGVENGIYVVSASTWARSNDTLVANTLVSVERGTLWADSILTLTTDTPLTVGTTSLVFTLVGRPLVSGSATANSAAMRDSSGDLTSRVIKSTVATGTAPLVVVSNTVVPNLNASLLTMDNAVIGLLTKDSGGTTKNIAYMTSANLMVYGASANATQINGTTLQHFNGTTTLNCVTAVTSTVAPAVTPNFVGQTYVNTVSKKTYVATGTTSSADWTATSGVTVISENSTATAGQATVTIGTAGFSTTTDVARLFVNGLKLRETAAYSVSGSTITLLNNYTLTVGDEIEVEIVKNGK